MGLDAPTILGAEISLFVYNLAGLLNKTNHLSVWINDVTGADDNEELVRLLTGYLHMHYSSHFP